MGILDVLQRKEEEEPRGILMVSQAPVEKSKPYTIKDFWKNWQKYYNTIQPVTDKMRDKLSMAVPAEAESAISNAVYIFGGDNNYPEDRLREDLRHIGKVESEYFHKKALNNAPERGWWQVHPATAMDSLRNAPKLFGEKFNEAFERYGGYKGLLKLSRDELQELLFLDNELAAAFAAVKVVQTFED
jgi:hypothetical protein